MADGLTAPEDLTPSQARVYVRIGTGMTAPDTADALGLSVRTVEKYCVTIRDRLGLEGGPVAAIREHAEARLLRLT